MKTWYVSIWLLVSYVGIFNLWIFLTKPWITGSGIFLCMILGVLIFVGHKQRYFQNSIDLSLHLFVVLDIILEAVLPIEHDHYYFYWCAIAFALVVGGYRAYLIRRHSKGLIEEKSSASWRRMG